MSTSNNGKAPLSPERRERYRELGKNTQISGGEQAKEMGRLGGKESVKSRRRKKTMQEIAIQILQTRHVDDEVRGRLEAIGLEGTYADAILEAVSSKAIREGSEKAAEFVARISGQGPRQTINLVTNDAYTTDEIRNMSDSDLAAILGRSAAEDDGAEVASESSD